MEAGMNSVTRTESRFSRDVAGRAAFSMERRVPLAFAGKFTRE